jgi:hypothetical protein
MPPATIEEQAVAMIDCAKAGAAAVHTHINSPTKDSQEHGPYHALDADLEGDIFDRVFEEVDVLTLNHGWEVVKAPSGGRIADYVTYHKELVERGNGPKYIQGSVIMTWNKMGGPHSVEAITAGVKYMEAHDIKPIWNLHIDHLMWVKRNFLDKGLCSEPYIIQLQMGKHRDERYFCDPWSHLGVIYEMNLVKEALKGSEYTLGIHPEGRNWLPITVMGMLLGCNQVRISKTSSTSTPTEMNSPKPPLKLSRKSLPLPKNWDVRSLPRKRLDKSSASNTPPNLRAIYCLTNNRINKGMNENGDYGNRWYRFYLLKTRKKTC